MFSWSSSEHRAQTRPQDEEPALPAKPRHPGGRERPHSAQLPPRAGRAAQPQGPLHGLQAHLHLLRYVALKLSKEDLMHVVTALFTLYVLLRILNEALNV